MQKGKISVFFHERLGGNPHSGHYDAKEIANRLHTIIPHARILLCIREQISMLASCYKQYVRIGGVRVLDDYLLPRWDQRIPLFDWTFYEYHRLIAYYFNLFGRDKVYVILVKELQHDPKVFFENLCGFIKVDCSNFHDFSGIVNPGIPDYEIETLRLMNFFKKEKTSVRDPNIFTNSLINQIISKYAYFKLFLNKRKKRNIVEEVRELFSGKFRESNRLTGDLIAKKLEKYGYELPEEQKNGTEQI